MQGETSSTINIGGFSTVYESIIDSISSVSDVDPTPRPVSSDVKIHRVPDKMERNEHEHNKYYAPKDVSIGPYHFGDPKLEPSQQLKVLFAKQLFFGKWRSLQNVCERLSEPNMVQKLRASYEENSTNKFGDKVFTRMMLLDACFILYYIKFFSGGKPRDYKVLTSHQIVFVHQDLFLLENQIPLEVIKEVMKEIMPNGNLLIIKQFINDHILTSMPKRRWYESLFCCAKDQSNSKESEDHFNEAMHDCDHLLHLLHYCLTKNRKLSIKAMNQPIYRRTFRNVSELMDVGINFKPSGARSLAQIDFHRGWVFSAKLGLPPISVDDSTKPMLLNLIAYEMCSDDKAYDSSWVTSYICLLDNLIDRPEDVRTLRKAGVLENNLGSDQDVVNMFKEIATDLVPNSFAYLEVMSRIQQHYQTWSNTVFSQLKHEFLNRPGEMTGLILALMALITQTYFSVWGPKTECDDLCMLLKKNHHL